MHFEGAIPICELTCSYRFSENLILTPPIPKRDFLLSSFVDAFIFIPYIYYFPEFLQSFLFWPLCLGTFMLAQHGEFKNMLGSCGLEKLNILPRVTQLASGAMGIKVSDI